MFDLSENTNGIDFPMPLNLLKFVELNVLSLFLIDPAKEIFLSTNKQAPIRLFGYAVTLFDVPICLFSPGEISSQSVRETPIKNKSIGCHRLDPTEYNK